MNTTSEFKNIEEYQLELPFTKSTYKVDGPFYENSYPVLSNDKEFLDHFNEILPSAKWDKRSLKKFIAQIYVTDCEFQIVECYACSRKVAEKFLDDQFLLTELYALPDFPSKFHNKKIKESQELFRSFQEQMNA